MKSILKRAIAASIPCAMLAGTSLAAIANPAISHPFMMRTFGARPFAAAAPKVLGGGATLPIPAYLGAAESSGTTGFGAAGSVFGYLASQSGGINIEYCATGSGKGKGVFFGAANTVDIACSNASSTSTATTFGFFPPSGGTAQSFPTVTGTDAPLLQTDYTSYLNNHASPLEPVELPSLFGSIAMVYNDPALSKSAARVTLTDAKICGVFNGSIKTFGALLGTSDTTAIVPVYRADGSGTSFNFSNHLATACKTGYYANQTFATADPGLPANAIGVKGNSAVIAQINSTAGAFGYVEAGFTADTPSATGPINYANVTNASNGVTYDPFSGLPAAANSISSGSLLNNVQVIQTSGTATGTSAPATTSALTGVRSGNCVKVVNPSVYAKVATGYPIVAVTYLLTNSAGNGSVVEAGLRLLEQDLATPANFKGSSSAKITTVDEATNSLSGTTGYSSLSSSLAGTVKTTATSCIGA